MTEAFIRPGWSQVQHDTVMRLYRMGLPSSAIAVEVGKTRNAILGYVHRSRMAGDKWAARRTQDTGMGHTHAPKPPKAHALKPVPSATRAGPPRVVRLLDRSSKDHGREGYLRRAGYEPPEPRRLALMHLKPRDCRYRCDDGSFCAHPGDGSWCPYHRLLCVERKVAAVDLAA